MDGWKNVSLSTLEGVDADIIGCHTVYRVNWLRAKARFDHWDEEDQIVRSEMRWTLLYFEHHTKAWEGRAEKSEALGESGHRAYALKQAAMWAQFGKDGEKRFNGCM